MSTFSDFVELLKQHLKDNQGAYVEHDSWVGDTESGFHSEDRFDFDKLVTEIDAFTEWFKGPRDTPPPERDGCGNSRRKA